MKKLIAMLLAVALVASFGATAAFAGISNADSAKYFSRWIGFDQDQQDWFADKGDFAVEVRDLWQQYDLDSKKPGLSASDKATLYAEFAAELATLKQENAQSKYGLAADLFDPTQDSFDMWQLAKQEVTDAGDLEDFYAQYEATDTYWKNYYTKKAAEDSAKGADAAAKTAAWNAYLASGRTELDKAVYDVAAANIKAQRALTNAKQAVADAKAQFATAQSTWKSTVEVKVAQAQAEYYVAVADAYADAVSEAVAAIYDALG